MDLFKLGDQGQTRSFGLATALVAGSTYAFSGFLIWFARKPARWESVKSAVFSLDFEFPVEWLNEKVTKGRGDADV